MMEYRSIKIDYKVYDSKEELPLDDRQILEAAIRAISGSYAPYSNFHVGAALRLVDGTVVTGSNQENAAYPSGHCAERLLPFIFNNL